ncbi:MAG: hypothetical protein IJ724_03595 [Muribaculaceae bacterium]|nr:hypothetical protein [Muribaculaceae bacterium]
MIINDAQAVQELRNELLRAVEDLEEQLKTTEAALDTVAETWQDNQTKKFVESFAEDKLKLQPLMDDIAWFEVDPLKKIQEWIEEYDRM